MIDQDLPTDICIVDDEHEVLDSVASNLKKSYNVIGFQSPETALKEFDQGLEPQIIISDLRMPGMDGHTFIERIREKGLKSQLIVTSGHSDKADILRSINNGVAAFLEKPFTVKELRDTVGKVSNNMNLAKETEEVMDLYRTTLCLVESLAKTYYERLVAVENSAVDLNINLISSPAAQVIYLESLRNERLIQRQLAQSKTRLNRMIARLSEWLLYSKK